MGVTEQQDARKALIEARVAVDAAIAKLPSPHVAHAVYVEALGVSLHTLREALSESSGSSEKPPLPTREELIGYLAECYRATGSIQTVGCPDEEVAGHAVIAVQMLAQRTQRGTYFDAESRTWVAREIVTSAGRTEEEARKALKSAIRLLADTWPPRDVDIALDALAAIGSEVLCEACAKVFCPHGERLHFHHDGCPACEAGDDPTPYHCFDSAYVGEPSESRSSSETQEERSAPLVIKGWDGHPDIVCKDVAAVIAEAERLTRVVVLADEEIAACRSEAQRRQRNRARAKMREAERNGVRWA